MSSKEESPGAHRKIFDSINDRPVDDVQLEIFYKPHTITLLLACISGLIYTAFVRDASDHQSNLFAGLIGVFVFFMIISVLAFPNGPFTRPHPIIWRMVFGCSVLYLLTVQFLIHLDYDAIRSIIVFFDPKMKNYTIDTEKEYGVNCWDITLEKLWGHLDW